MKFIHLTDPHLVPAGKELYGKDPLVGLRAAIDDINAHQSDAERVILTGDLTHWGEPAAFDALSDALSQLTLPCHLLVGNHDARDAFMERFPNQGVDTAGFIQSSLATEHGVFLFLDTNLIGTAAGHYCEERLSWLGAELDRTAPEDVFLFMHHPPFDIGIAPMDRIGLQQKDAFWDAIAPHADRIRHLFYGHVHRNISGSWRGIPFSTVRGTNHQIWLNFSSEKNIASHEPPGYCVVFVDEMSVVVHFHDFLDNSPKFDLRDSPFDDWARRPKASEE